MIGMTMSKAVSLGKPALRVTWTTPQSDVAISQYQLQYRRKWASWRAVSPTPPGSATSTVLQTLDVGTAYQVRIRAVSAIGNGMWSRVESEITYMGQLSGKFEVIEITHFDIDVEAVYHGIICLQSYLTFSYF